jgi:hypothetical protein
MIKLANASILALFSTNVLAMEDKALNKVDMAGAMILTIPLVILFCTVFIYYKNKKKVVTKKSYASTNVIVEQSKYNLPKSESNKKGSGNLVDSIDAITDLVPNHATKVASAVVTTDLISNGGDMSGGGSSLDFDLDFDFDWD